MQNNRLKVRHYGQYLIVLPTIYACGCVSSGWVYWVYHVAWNPNNLGENHNPKASDCHRRKIINWASNNQRCNVWAIIIVLVAVACCKIETWCDAGVHHYGCCGPCGEPTTQICMPDCPWNATNPFFLINFNGATARLRTQCLN